MATGEMPKRMGIWRGRAVPMAMVAYMRRAAMMPEVRWDLPCLCTR